VVSQGIVCSILLLTEDTAKNAFCTLQSIAKELLKLVDSSTQTHRICFEPLPPNEVEAVQAVQANIWKSTKARDRNKQVSLVRYMATKLVEGGFVLFHFDGDKTWADKSSSENVRQFNETLCARVKLRIQETFQEKKRTDAVEPFMTRLLPVTPFYSIEAWLYQNTRVAKELCEEAHRGEHTDDFEKWERDRALLDEVSAPQKECCLAGMHNPMLAANSYPSREVMAVGKSFAATFELLNSCEDLRRALKRTHTQA
jgi:hypothetical protein